MSVFVLVNCFYPAKDKDSGENVMLVIKPDECIDCGLCVDTCPVNAILSNIDTIDGKMVEDIEAMSMDDIGLTGDQKLVKKMLHINKHCSEIAEDPIEDMVDPHPESEKYRDRSDKLEIAVNKLGIDL